MQEKNGAVRNIFSGCEEREKTCGAPAKLRVRSKPIRKSGVSRLAALERVGRVHWTKHSGPRDAVLNSRGSFLHTNSSREHAHDIQGLALPLCCNFPDSDRAARADERNGAAQVHRGRSAAIAVGP